MALVMIHWSIKPDREASFFANRPPVPPGTKGFIREDLYRIAAIDGAPDGVVNFVNVAEWDRPDDFYAHFDIPRGVAPLQKEFEAAPRRREWLEVVPAGSPKPWSSEATPVKR